MTPNKMTEIDIGEEEVGQGRRAWRLERQVDVRGDAEEMLLRETAPRPSNIYLPCHKPESARTDYIH